MCILIRINFYNLIYIGNVHFAIMRKVNAGQGPSERCIYIYCGAHVVMFSRENLFARGVIFKYKKYVIIITHTQSKK